jgi:hypothetical protein
MGIRMPSRIRGTRFLHRCYCGIWVELSDNCSCNLHPVEESDKHVIETSLLSSICDWKI